jgi:hypothetical protein
MNTTAPPESVKTSEIQTQPISVESIEEAICAQVLERLGRPFYLFKIDAGNVGGSNHRVNVWCETPPKEESMFGGYEISDSFYVKVSPEGGIISSDPPIKKKY